MIEVTVWLLSMWGNPHTGALTQVQWPVFKTEQQCVQYLKTLPRTESSGPTYRCGEAPILLVKTGLTVPAEVLSK